MRTIVVCLWATISISETLRIQMRTIPISRSFLYYAPFKALLSKLKTYRQYYIVLSLEGPRLNLCFQRSPHSSKRLQTVSIQASIHSLLTLSSTVILSTKSMQNLRMLWTNSIKRHSTIDFTNFRHRDFSRTLTIQTSEEITFKMYF